MGWLGQIFRFLAEAVGFGRQRDEEKNAPDVKAAAIAVDEQRSQDETRKTIARKDIDEERREIGE